MDLGDDTRFDPRVTRIPTPFRRMRGFPWLVALVAGLISSIAMYYVSVKVIVPKAIERAENEMRAQIRAQIEADQAVAKAQEPVLTDEVKWAKAHIPPAANADQVRLTSLKPFAVDGASAKQMGPKYYLVAPLKGDKPYYAAWDGTCAIAVPRPDNGGVEVDINGADSRTNCEGSRKISETPLVTADRNIFDWELAGTITPVMPSYILGVYTNMSREMTPVKYSALNAAYDWNIELDEDRVVAKGSEPEEVLDFGYIADAKGEHESIKLDPANGLKANLVPVLGEISRLEGALKVAGILRDDEPITDKGAFQKFALSLTNAWPTALHVFHMLSPAEQATAINTLLPYLSTMMVRYAPDQARYIVATPYATVQDHRLQGKPPVSDTFEDEGEGTDTEAPGFTNGDLWWHGVLYRRGPAVYAQAQAELARQLTAIATAKNG